ncbi:MAG: hypothetical protein H6603_00715 [Flavobacteriales bacterium]|nr:hypothetical protein [Flavobacteriales bacterium]MCB9191123.1 hypothetical protein [Flavobacteriales bacterium]MCB9203469.1 hypothetical protein [Flavobacteriales bacterium]
MKRLFPYLILAVFAIGCNPDADNPFDDPDNLPPNDTTAFGELDPTSFVGLHQNIFKPTCANSGCHDGTFEPDFRTIESAYNTLVYHSVIKNNPSNSYQYRVKPGSISESIMWLRLNEDIDGISGIMPLDAFYDPESEWNQNKAEHLSNINTWIMNGALDMFGNAPDINDQQPGIAGIYAEADGQPCVIFERVGVPLGAQQVSIWFALTDKETAAQSLQSATVKMSGLINVDEDTLAVEFPLQVLGSAESHPSFLNDPVDFYHKFSFSTAAYPPDSTYYMRVSVKDPLQPDTTQIPQDGSQFYIKRLFSWNYLD